MIESSGMLNHVKVELVSNILETILLPSPADDVMNNAVCFHLSQNKTLGEQWAKLDGQRYSVPVLATGRIVDKTKQVDRAAMLENCLWELLGLNLSQDNGYLNRVFFMGFLFLQANAGVMTTSFQIIYNSSITISFSAT